MSITLTSQAANKIREIAANDESTGDNWRLRAKVVGGGCAGFSYDLSFENNDQHDESDDTFVTENITIVVDALSINYVDGTVISYVENGLYGEGFKFENPNSKGSCGCGSSFSA